mgnify:CR=1 FL=1
MVVCVRVCVFMCVYVCLCVFVCLCLCVCVYMYIYIYINICIYISIFLNFCLFLYVFIFFNSYIYVYICKYILTVLAQVGAFKKWRHWTPTFFLLAAKRGLIWNPPCLYPPCLTCLEDCIFPIEKLVEERLAGGELRREHSRQHRRPTARDLRFVLEYQRPPCRIPVPDLLEAKKAECSSLTSFQVPGEDKICSRSNRNGWVRLK